LSLALRAFDAGYFCFVSSQQVIMPAFILFDAYQAIRLMW